MSQWQTICELNDIIPGTGVCALVDGKQIALFRPEPNEQLFALSNIDPFEHSSVLSRGLIGHSQKSGFYVASPLKKQRFALQNGQCLDDEALSIASYPVRVEGSEVQLKAELSD